MRPVSRIRDLQKNFRSIVYSATKKCKKPSSISRHIAIKLQKYVVNKDIFSYKCNESEGVITVDIKLTNMSTIPEFIYTIDTNKKTSYEGIKLAI